MKIGEKIKTGRRNMGMTQSEMADLIPMNQSNYSKIERNEQNPSIRQLQQICRILKLDPRWLLGLEDVEFIPIAQFVQR